MNFIGKFLEGEINEKPFLIFTLLPQADSLPSSSSFSSSSGKAAIDLSPPQPLYLCPFLRLKAQKLKPEENGLDHRFIPFDVSPHFPHTRSGDQQVQCLLDSNTHGDICKLPVVPLFWCNNKEPHYDEFYCHACESLNVEIGTDYYLCVTCNRHFHKECVESLVEVKHPSYPFFSLKLYSRPTSNHDYWLCIYCNKRIGDMFYHCPTNNVCMHLFCALKPIPFVINHPKRHLHPLTYFPKQASLACNVCGLIKKLIPTYVCVGCVFIVHQDCIYFPYVIRISRHQHRISFTSSLPSGNLFCGVCRRKVDNDCCAYSCNKCEDYFVHSRCALRRDLWDGEELEGVPEVSEIVVEPFERIADGIILHFSHGHHLKLHISRIYCQDKFCQACVLPVYEGNYYACLDQCDFVLHEACANSPLKKHHPLHALSLTLKVVTNGYDNDKGYFHCNACRRRCCGFVYESPAVYQDFRLDLRCASVSEPFQYQGHDHPLFLALNPEEEISAICQICEEGNEKIESWRRRKLNCIKCDYIICFECATLPYKARYKHDKHILAFRDGKEASDHPDWCDVCESKIVYPIKGGLYACDDYCCTTLHVECLLGRYPYHRKQGQTVKSHFKRKFQILHNNTLSRPFCHGCKQRCLDKIVFKRRNDVFCSPFCAGL